MNAQNLLAALHEKILDLIASEESNPVVIADQLLAVIAPECKDFPDPAFRHWIFTNALDLTTILRREQEHDESMNAFDVIDELE